MLSRGFREFIASLNSNKVRFLVIGAYALAFHGHPRYTKDLDIWISADPENVVKVLNALNDFGFGGMGISAEDLTSTGTVIQLGYPPNRIDILNSPDGVNFDECYANKIEIELDGVAVPIIDIDNLRSNKLASGRLQDLADVEALEKD